MYTTTKTRIDDVPANIRAIFDDAVNSAPDADARANAELLREYYTNPEFRQWLEDYSYAMATRKKATR